MRLHKDVKSEESKSTLKMLGRDGREDYEMQIPASARRHPKSQALM
jgi:hypothetical protein